MGLGSICCLFTNFKGVKTMKPPSFFIKFIWTLLTILLILIIYYLINIGNNFVSDRKKIKINDKKILPVITGLIFLFLIFNLFKKYPILSETFYTIIFSAILAYLFNPVINFLESKKVNRLKGVLLLYLGIVALFLILAFLVIPKSTTEIKRLVVYMPMYLEKASSVIDELYNKYYSTLGDLPPMFQGVQQVVMENIVGIEHMVVNGLKNFIGGIMNTFSKLVSLILTPILTFYFLVDKDYFKNTLMGFIPTKYKEDCKKLCFEIDDSLSKFVRGKIIMAAYVGIATSIVLLIMGIDFAIVIGFITGIADIIPYIGPFLGFLPAVFFAYLISPLKAIWIALFFVFIQWAENNILAPKVIGETTGIHPLIILISIIVGGGIFGVLGMILAVPVVAVFMILFKFISNRRPPNIQN
ncbi:Predicted PurR-regulated permease PerM [Tissierella praeacuta DSM 18095]|uniref:Predicted PurR-regulated permease PerM n=2 Tax=Tissierella praeacuta TaxID=43131 RepID=A0A1M4SAG9_9FIRM|nr:putative PurR-regulated permease PerM [Tissierella praeacuta]SHE29224.1 Predicted PurR-regulated permease PerM [Tissierella praeacuta DSM 18095]SUP01203.1 pheromone autoinducer 2 transporter [Tissierella praeacuta]